MTEMVQAGSYGRGSYGRAEALMREAFAHAGLRVSYATESTNPVLDDNGKPYDVVVRDPTVFNTWLLHGSVGLGDSYIQGKWDAPDLADVICRMSRLDSTIKQRLFKSWHAKVAWSAATLRNMQSRSRASLVAEKHYDLGNDFFEEWLDPYMQYSCGYWRDATSLEEAQVAKMRLVGEKLRLKPGMKVLDIGCGWGGLARFLAQTWDVEVKAITISEEQAAYAQEKFANDPRVSVELKDYREINGQYDRVVSVAMIEAVGYKNYGTFMRICASVLKEEGLMLLHTIGSNRSLRSVADPWFHKHIFPNGMLPSVCQLGQALERSRMVLEDWQNFGADYDRTLLEWHRRFMAGQEVHKMRFGERFVRTWQYYLLNSAGTFRARRIQLWQLVLSKSGMLGGYRTVT